MVFNCMLLSRRCNICDPRSLLLNAGSAAALPLERGRMQLPIAPSQDNDYGVAAAVQWGSMGLMLGVDCVPLSLLITVCKKGRQVATHLLQQRQGPGGC